MMEGTHAHKIIVDHDYCNITIGVNLSQRNVFIPYCLEKNIFSSCENVYVIMQKSIWAISLNFLVICYKFAIIV